MPSDAKMRSDRRPVAKWTALRVHRWIMAATAVPLLWIAIFGTVLQGRDLFTISRNAPADRDEMRSIDAGQDVMDGKAASGATMMRPPALDAAPLSDQDLRRLVRVGISSVARVSPGAAIVSIDVSRDKGAERISATVGIPHPRVLLFSSDGLPVRPSGPPRPMGWHEFLKTLHAGSFLSEWGSMIGLYCGLALSILSITGVLAYLAVWRRRNAAGRREMFWR